MPLASQNGSGYPRAAGTNSPDLTTKLGHFSVILPPCQEPTILVVHAVCKGCLGVHSDHQYFLKKGFTTPWDDLVSLTCRRKNFMLSSMRSL